MNTRPVFFRVSRNRRKAASAPATRPKALSGSIAKYSRGLALSVLAGSAALLAVSALLSVQSAQAANIILYDGDTSATWATGGNWTLGVAPTNDLTTDIAKFDLATYTFQPTAPTNRSINGLIMGASSGAITITTLLNTSRLNIGTGGIVMDAGTGTLTIGIAPTQGVTLGASQSWTNNSSSLLTVSSVANDADVTPFTLTLDGSGSGGITISNVIANGGTIGTTALIVNMSGTGVVTLSGANSLTGGIALNQGTLVATVAGAFGTSANTLTFGGGNLDLRAGTNVALTYTGALDLNSTNQTIYVNTAAATAGLTHLVSGALTLGTQTTTVSAGSNINADTNYGLTLSGAKTFAAANSNATFTINGNGSGNGTLSLITGSINTGGFTQTLTFNSGSGSGVRSAVIAGAFTGSNGILDLAGNAPVTINALTTTGNAVRVSGTGTYTFAGVSTFTGGVILNNASATVIATVAGGLGATSGKVKFNVAGTTLNLRSAGLSYTSGIDSTSFGGTIISEPATNVTGVTQTMTLANTLGTNTVIISPGQTLVDTAYGLTLSGANSFSAASTNATFTINGNGTGAGTLTMSGGFDTGGNTQTLTFNNGSGSGANKAVISGAFTGSDGTLVLASSAPVTVGALTGTANAVQVNSTTGGIYTFNGASTFTGGVSLNNGTLVLGTSSVVTAGALVSSPVGTGTFEIGTASQAVILSTNVANTTPRTVSNVISLNNDVTFTTSTATGRIALNVMNGLTTPNTITLTRTNQLSAANTMTVDLVGAIGDGSNGFGLTFTGGGTWNIGNNTIPENIANTYTGLTTVSAGNVTLNKTANVDAIAGNLTISGTGTVTLGANNENIKDTSTVTVSTGGTLAMSGKSETIATLILTGGTVSTTTGTLTASNTFDLQAGTVSSALAGSVGAAKTTAGTVTLSGPSTFNGGVTLTAGTLNINSVGVAATNGPLGNGGTFAINGGTIDNTSGSAKVVLNVNPITLGGDFAFSTGAGTSTANNLTLPGEITMAADRIVTLNGLGALTLSGKLTNTSDSVRTLTVNNGTGTGTTSILTIGSYDLTGPGSTAARNNIINGTGRVTISGVVADGVSAGSGLTKAGTGTLTLSNAANTYGGVTTITGGTLSVFTLADGGNPSGIGNSSSAAANLVLDGGTLRFFGNVDNTTNRAFTVTANGGGIDHTSGSTGAVLTITGTPVFSGTGNRTFTLTGTGNGVNTISGDIVDPSSGATSVTKTGASATATWVLAGNNTFTGGLTLDGGRLYVASNANLGDTSGGAAGQITVLSDSTLRISASVGSSRQINLTAGTLTFGSINLSGIAVFTFSTDQKVTGSGNISVLRIAQGNNAVTLSSASNDFTGSITIDAANNGNNNSQTLNIASLVDGVGYGNIRFGLVDVASVQQTFNYTGASNLNLANRRIEFFGSGLANGTLTSATNAINVSTNLLVPADSSSVKTLILSAPLNVTSTFSGNIVNGTGTTVVALTKSGVGTWVLSGANTYTGATAVSAGTLIARNGTAFGTTSTANVTVATQTGMSYYAATDVPLNIGGTLDITGGTATVIGGSIGATTTSARINVAGNATATAAAVKVNIYGNSFSGTTDGTGTYTLVQGIGGGSTLSSATYTLGTVYNATNFTVGTTIGSAPGTVTAAITAATALTGDEAYWRGTATAGLTKVWAASNGSADSNWAKTAGGSVQSLVPGSAANVFIAASPTVAATTTTLGADMTIKTLNIQDTTNGLGLNADGYTLTITPASSAVGITMDASVPASTIAANVALGAAQTWTNNSANSLTVSGRVSGAFALTTAGTGTQILSGANTYSGVTNVNSGTLNLRNSSALGTTANTITVASGAKLQFQSGIAVPIAKTLIISQPTMVFASGGTATSDGIYTVRSFTTSGTLDVTSGGTVDYLIVAGGGGGAVHNTGGAGGGAGGMLTGTTSVNAQSYSVTIGAGGAGAGPTSGEAGGAQGGNSSAFSLTAIGGGYGASYGSGGAGGSGGGDAGAGASGLPGGADTAGQGNRGGAGNGGTRGGSGGGAGAAGGSGTAGILAGGAGLASTITGSSVTYAKGGDARNFQTPDSNNNPTNTGGVNLNGAANTGNGGAGQSHGVSINVTAGTGGSGIVVIRYVGGGALENVSGDNTWSGAITLGSTIGISSLADTLTLGGAIGESGSGYGITKVGAGTVALSVANTYTGATSVLQGTLEVTANNALGTNAAGTSVTAGATLKLTGVNYSTAEGLTINGTGVGGTAGALASSGTTTFAGLITAATSATINAISGTLELSGGLVKNGTTLTFTGAGAFTISSVISGASANSDLVVDGTTVTLTAANTYNGPTTITNGGTLIANILGALPLSPTPRSAVSFTGSGNPTLNLGASQEVASLSSSTTSAVVNLSATGTNTLTVGAASGTTTFTGSIGGTSGNLIKDGASTQVLTGTNNTYTGTTTVSAGTLEVQGSLSGTTAVTVNTSGTLLLNSAASPIINTAATMTVGGGTVKIDNSLSNTNQTFGSLTLTGTSILDFGTGTNGNTMTFSSLSFTGTKLNVYNWTGSAYGAGVADTGTFADTQDRLLFNADTIYSGTSDSRIEFFSDGGTTSLGFGQEVAFGSQFELVPITAVPEPATTALIGSIALCALIGYRERRRFTGFGKRMAARK